MDGSFCEVLDSAEEHLFALENAQVYWNSKKICQFKSSETDSYKNILFPSQTSLK